MLLNNRYRVLRTLGGGGFGDTFLAEDTQMPSLRRCVIKQLKPIHNNPEVYQLVQARFQREAAILEELGGNCEQIPSLYAYFQEKELFYLVQEWIEGDTLSERLQKQGVFSETAVRNLLCDLLPVLDSIHSRGIIHRDIKPDNIILRILRSPSSNLGSGIPAEKPVLIDFGAVRESMGTIVNSQGSPTSSIVIGTPGFMPSEQAMGRPIYVSDIYSLGITVIYLLTGKQPQELPTDPRTGEMVWHNYAPYLSPQMRAILEKATAYHPRDRYNNAQEMLYALQQQSIQSMGQPSESIPTAVSQPMASQANPTPAYSNSIPHTVPNTIPVSPVNSPSPVNYQQTPTPYQTQQNLAQVPANSNQKTILISGIIAAGLIGAAGIISFALNRQPNPATPIAQENSILNDSPASNPTNTTSPTTPALTTDTTDTIDVAPSQPSPPAVEAPVNTAPIDQSNSTPTENRDTNLTGDTASNSNSSSQPVIQETTPPNIDNNPKQNTNITQTPIPTTTIETQPDTATPTSSPVDFVRGYYSSINRGNLQTSWNLLSPEFRSNRRLHPQGYNSYVNWWGGQVQRVQINQLRPIATGNNTATVEAKLTYTLKNGNKSPSDVRFYLVWNPRDRNWTIRDAQALRG